MFEKPFLKFGCRTSCMVNPTILKITRFYSSFETLENIMYGFCNFFTRSKTGKMFNKSADVAVFEVH